MKPVKRVKPTAQEGHAAGLWLAERAPHVMLAEFGSRPGPHESHASNRFYVLIESLNQALGPVSKDDKVTAVLHELDGAVWDIAVEHEDRAWHAAWALAMRLREGDGASRAPRQR